MNDELINKDGNLSVIKEGRFNVTNTQYLGLFGSFCTCISDLCVCVFIYVYVHAV